MLRLHLFSFFPFIFLSLFALLFGVLGFFLFFFSFFSKNNDIIMTSFLFVFL